MNLSTSIDGSAVLETTRATEFVPGTNLAGELACADWRYLLPSLQTGNVLCLGVPSVRTVSVLSTAGSRIIVASQDRQGLRDLEETCRRTGITNLHKVAIEDFAALPFCSHTMGLIWLTGSQGLAIPIRTQGLVPELDRLLSAQGAIYFEIRGWINRWRSLRTIKGFSKHGLGSPRIFWLTPQRGEMRTALPVWDGDIARHFFGHVMYGQSLRNRTLSRIGGILSRLGLLRLILLRRAVLIQRKESAGTSKQAPQYLAFLAKQAGIDLRGYRFGFSARGTYNSNKVTFYLFNELGKTPEIVVKMTRAPRFNYRLENEHRILSLLKEKGFVSPDTYPEPLFFDYHHDLAVLGERAIQGHPFRKRTQANATCPLARQAIDWLVQLGTASADDRLASAAEVAESLSELFRRFNEVYSLTKEERAFLTDQIERLRNEPQRFPLVFQHGDPGTWNILVSESERVIFLDWEAGEAHGIPLWDLFYFMKTFGSWISRTQGSHDGLANFARHFLMASPLGQLQAEVVRRYCCSVGLEPALVEPLFYTCWMHRALKECTRLPEASLQNGHYFNLLRLCIARRDSPGFRALFV